MIINFNGKALGLRDLKKIFSVHWYTCKRDGVTGMQKKKCSKTKIEISTTHKQKKTTRDNERVDISFWQSIK